MPITVQFATNRKLAGSGQALAHYTNDIAALSDPTQVTYGTAFVNEVNLTADTVGGIFAFQDVQQGAFSAQAVGDLGDAGRDLLVFIHGFANTFENAITRAAFNRDWLAAAPGGVDTSVVAFCWPSEGHVLGIGLPDAAYRADQHKAQLGGLHLRTFLANMDPIIRRARTQGRRVFLLVHSMGHLALEAGLSDWFAHGNGDADLFDAAFLAAGDERSDTFEFPLSARLSGLHRLCRRVVILFNNADAVLGVSSVVNGFTRRLGQQGPDHRFDPLRFPPAEYAMLDCSGFHDYAVDFASSHQYYRRSPGVRGLIVGEMA